jgi:1-acyl-sn-glycerol-3-phosphate acyltransferase
MIKPPLKIFLLLLWAALWFFPVWIAKASGKLKWRDEFIQLFCRGALYIVGIRLHVDGHISHIRPLLMVSNHISYYDIFILGSHVPARFTPKKEIGSWPLIGGIARVTDSILVDRRPGKIKEAGQNMYKALAKGDVVSLFPESTTGNGLHVLPFKSSFFSLAETPIEGKELTVQPVAFTYTRIGSLPVDTTQWPIIAWYGDMYMMPHLWKVLKFGRMDVELQFLPPVTLSECGDRKALAAHCQEAISMAIESLKQKPVLPQRTLISFISSSFKSKS